MHHDCTCGLHNVWLKNGYAPGREGHAHYQDPAGLERAIATELCMSPHRLAPEGTRFLRSLLRMTQAELDAALEVEPGTAARCEAGLHALPDTRSRMLRLLATEVLNPGAIAPEVADQPLAPAQRLLFEYVQGRWHCAERVTAPALLAETPPPG